KHFMEFTPVFHLSTPSCKNQGVEEHLLHEQPCHNIVAECFRSFTETSDKFPLVRRCLIRNESAVFICQQCTGVLRAGEQMDIRVSCYHPAYVRFAVEGSLPVPEGGIDFPTAAHHPLEHGDFQLTGPFRVGIEDEQPFIFECIMDEGME